MPSSDIDLLIVLSDTDLRFLDRAAKYLPDGFPVGIDVFAYTQEELDVMLSDGNPFIKRAMETGRLLFSRT